MYQFSLSLIKHPENWIITKEEFALAHSSEELIFMAREAWHWEQLGLWNQRKLVLLFVFLLSFQPNLAYGSTYIQAIF